jgi:hypothetical protein
MTLPRHPQPPAYRALALAALLLATLLPAATAFAAAPTPGPPLTIRRAPGPITVDGDLNDAGWKDATPITVWYETRVGDNVEPQVRNVAWLTYDDQYFYAAFQFDDPTPGGIRAPIGDHDNVNSTTDYGGVIIDTRNDGKSAQMFLANPNGVQYDAISNDATGEDNSPDFYWDSMGKVTKTGWNLEIRIPFSSLRYSQSSPTFGILLYRNYPRERRFQFFSARLPRNVNCFICNESKLTGLTGLTSGAHLVVAPYATAEQKAEPVPALGSPLERGDVQSDGGADVKWNPSAGLALDATFNPDFSQIEADAAQITANERFALFYPEKRPFFLEGVDLFAAPMQAVYTRTITSPSAGGRATGRIGSNAYTVLFTHDRGGGSVVIPGPFSSDFAAQEFSSNVGIGRVRHDMGSSFVSALATGREIDGGGHNYVFGPDFQWRPRPSDNITGQFLWSDSRTPNRPDLASEWDGRSLQDHAGLLYVSHNTPHWDLFTQGLDIGPEFRADQGFIPQVGYREIYFETGYTIRAPKALLSRTRLWTIEWEDAEPDGSLITRRGSFGAGIDSFWNSFWRLEANWDDFMVGDQLLSRFRPRIHWEASPGSLINFFMLQADLGDEVDFANARKGTGATLMGTLTLHPGNHLELRGDASTRWIDEDLGAGTSRLFTAEVGRLRAQWSFNARSFVRLIGQYTQTTRDTSMYAFTISPKESAFGGSALFAYKVNWQTVVYVGYGDQRVYLQPTDKLEPMERQAFAKISYAWQR